MLISHRKKFIYTKTVKTAGTSVESYFERYCMPEGEWEFSHTREQYVNSEGIIGQRGGDIKGKEWFNHMSAADISEKIGSHIWNSYFKFCVVRNPFDKLVSFFYFLEKQGHLDPDENDNQIERFRKWIRSGISVIDRDKYMIGGEMSVDYIIRYEDLESGIRYVCDKVDVPFEPADIPRLKSAVRDRSIPVNHFYDRETARIVGEVYEFEIREFGYALPK